MSEISKTNVSQPKVSVVIPNWNGAEVIVDCLDSLARQTLKPDEIIVVDNGSVDNSVSLIEHKFSSVIIIKLDHNYGFTGGVNAGIKAAKGEWVALLNNDAVVSDDWLKKLAESANKNSKASIFTSKILIQSNSKELKIDSTGDFYSPYGLPFPRGRDEVDRGQYDKDLEIFAASGGASMYRSDLFDKIGLFDQNYFAYFEDVDLSFRAQLAGFGVCYVPTAVVYHKLGHTSGGGKSKFSRYHTMKNNWYLYLKNMPAKLFWKYLPRYLLTQALLLTSSVKSGLILTHVRASFMALINTPKMLIKRHKIQSSRCLSSSEVEAKLYCDWPPMQKDTLKSYFPWAFRDK